ncbi:MAG: succinate dehydrogenase iron-sulfur subunit [Trueperaceae bacterium]|jgi:succinate dehydrogenase / fumarate reductase iron-sulfur subunit|nr:succinate dehydrogenase iron-sulfur subunit [Truepera sp.]HRN18990.1 succinate dehydrogenase iron-sulfur subunit [Trueperaceae bacterium]HRQ10343.1 succinate dehydrogenase iron-sulfur subunit [Trueperaceae bacterium]
MHVTMEIRRYDPERDEKPHWETYELEAEPAERVLDLLNRVKWEQDGSLSFRRSCGHGVCGSDAMRINGFNHLACKVLARDVGPRIKIQPLGAFPVLKDLIVDMDGFLDQYKAVRPYLVPAEGAVPPRERLQSGEERRVFDDTTKCILCAACTSSCPIFWTNGRYIGPMAIVNAHRFIFDSRDAHPEAHLEAMRPPDGVWRCRKAYNCTDCCPRGIRITEHIIEVERFIAMSDA